MTAPGGACCSLGCRGYLHSLLEAHISLGTINHINRHLAQAHLLAMSFKGVLPLVRNSWLDRPFHRCNTLVQPNLELFVAQLTLIFKD